MSKTKKYLMLLAAIGLIATAAGGVGTFAGFNAEVANTGNYFQTGTLFLHDTGGGTTCTSESATNNLNRSSGDTCNALFQVTLTSATTPTYYAIALKNAGTIDASGIKFYAGGAGCQATSASSVTAGALSQNETGTVTLLHVSSITYGIPNNTTITVSGQNFTTSAAVATSAGATTIPINSQAITGTLASGSNVTYVPSFGAANLCNGLDVGIVETNATQAGGNVIGNAVGCAYGTVSGSTCSLSSSYTLGNLPYETDPSYGTAGHAPLPLTLVSGLNGNAGGNLSQGQTRTFLIAVKPDATFGNAYQNKKATVDLVWHIDQV